jgi:hypothetical protein
MKIFIIVSLATTAIAQTSSSSGSGSAGAILVTPSGARLGATLEPTMQGQVVVGAPYSAARSANMFRLLLTGRT